MIAIAAALAVLVASPALRSQARPRRVRRLRKIDRRAAERDGGRDDHVAADRRAVPRAHRRLRSARADDQRVHLAEPEGARRGRRRSTPSGKPGGRAGRCTASRSRSRTTTSRRICRRPADRWRSQGFAAGRDAFMVRKLRQAGAVVIGKTNLHELAYGITSVSSMGGQTRNPYDPSRNPGGSSGGTGAAVARELRRRRHGHRHLRIDPHSVGAQQPVRPARHARPVEPRRHHPALADAGHRRTAGAIRHRSDPDARRDGRLRSGRPGDERERRQDPAHLHGQRRRQLARQRPRRAS